MATIEEIKGAAKEVRLSTSVRPGCFYPNPPVKLRYIEVVTSHLPKNEGINVGDIVHTDMVDESGKYPFTLRIKEKRSWWPIYCFELVKE